jgi:heavy metal efflux system protein
VPIGFYVIGFHFISSKIQKIMLRYIVAFSVRRKALVYAGVILLIAGGVYATLSIPLDAVPDITNNQVQVITSSDGLPAEDVERLVTFPIEQSLANLPGVTEIRSISRFGLSLVTVVFKESVPTLEARQLIGEQLQQVSADIPASIGRPAMMPITTGLGEIYQYTLEVDPDHAHRYDATALRSLQDWLVKRQLTGIEGIIDISSFGGHVKQYEVAYVPAKMASLGVSPTMLLEALERNNANTGGGYLNEGSNAIYLRTEGLIKNASDLRKIRVTSHRGMPVLVADVAHVRDGKALRYGAMTKDGKGEVVGGITLLLKDANAQTTVKLVKERIASIQNSLPEGVRIVPYLDRSDLVGRTISTAVENLAIGGLVVALVLIFFLGDFRSGLLVASIVPLSMLFALLMMKIFGVSANLMSLGAVDLGIVVDGAVIIVEGILHAMAITVAGKHLDRNQMDKLVVDSTVQVYKSAAFGVLIILVVFFPVMYLGGIEGKMFRPMAITLIFALAGALLLSVTFIPAAASQLLRKVQFGKPRMGERWMLGMASRYRKWLHGALPARTFTMAGLVLALAITIWRITAMGAVFIPDLEEGDLAMQMAMPSGSNLEEVVALSTEVEQALLAQFPEIRGIVSKIGTAEIPTDPMAIEDVDVMILMQPKDTWTSADNRYALVAMMKEVLNAFPEVSFEFSQPIQLRFNELISGSKADIAVKIFGPDNEVLHQLGERAEGIIAKIAGAADVKLERTEGLRQWVLTPQRDQLALHGIAIEDVNIAIQSAYAGVPAGVVYEDERRFDLVMRIDQAPDAALDLSGTLLNSPLGGSVPLSALVDKQRKEGVSMVSREQAQRRIAVGVNVRDRSLTDVVHDIQQALDAGLELPPGYSLRYEGQFRNYEEARSRLSVAVPISLFIILILLYFAFDKLRHALFVFSAVPFTTIGGIWALSLRGMPFSISAGIGFIALFGVGVLNSIVLISHINHVRTTQPDWHLRDVVSRAASDRFRPVLLTALTAILGFLPMAISTNAGAEVQRPLATVVIGGLLVDTFLTLIYLPKLYFWLEGRKARAPFGKNGRSSMAGLLLILLFIGGSHYGLAQQAEPIAWEAFRQAAMMSNPNLEIRELALEIERERSGENWQIAPTEVEYGYGQLNRVPFASDYQWQFSQRFGSIPEHIHRGKAQQARILASEAEVMAYRKNFEAELKAAYLTWIVAIERLKLVQNYSNRLDTLRLRVQAQAQVGEISDTELHFFEAVRMGMRREKAQTEVDLSQSRLDLEVLCLFALDALLPEEDHGFGVLHPVPDTLLTSPFFKAQEVRIAESEYALKMQRSAFFPALSAGYQRARLEGEAGGDAFFLGLALPLWYGPDRSRSRQASLALDQEQLRLDASKFAVNAEARRDYDAYASYRSIYESEGIEFYNAAQTLNAKATSSFEKGETDAYQLLQALQSAYQLHLEYLGLAADYGRSRIHLSRYAQ